MHYIDIDFLNQKIAGLKPKFQTAKPFRHIMFDGFFPAKTAELIYDAYPTVENGLWDGTTFIDQKNKFQKSRFEEGSIMDIVFKELNSPVFLDWLQKLTEMEEPLIGDEELFGGGLHQSMNGAFLNVHIDYNIHPKTKFHRRLNVLVYMNKEWKDEYGGQLELWDLSKGKKLLLGSYAPTFNRCVIFETNEISFHGHPNPLKVPNNVTRKSLATYYYTKNRPVNELASDHNTVYVNTEGLLGQVKRFNSGVKAFLERINKK